MNIKIDSDASMRQFGEQLGKLLHGGELIELAGDVGAGKTTLVKGLARGLAVDDTVQSPTFTISRVYEARDSLELAHYDFYRLGEPGIMAIEIEEAIRDPRSIVVIEWGGIVEGVLPEDRLAIVLETTSENERMLTLKAHGANSKRLMEGML